MVVTVPALAWAQPAPKAGIRQSSQITIDADTAHVIELAEPAKTVFVANTDLADIHVVTATSVLVYGKKPGTTTVFAIGENGETASYSVRVTRPTGELLSALHREVPSARVTISTAPDGIAVSGRVGSPRDAEKLRSVAKQFVGEKETLNFDVAVDSATQVTLRVRVAEVSRNINRALGVNLGAVLNTGSLAVGLLTNRLLSGAVVPADTTSTFGTASASVSGRNGNASALIDAMDQQGLATILAEPNLTTTSGETARFLAGGEYPIPVPQGNQTVTVDYKRYGVSVDFTPTVLDGNRISIKVRPEVSQLSNIGNLQLNGVSIPALTVTSVDTTVELASGESFAIAGLFQNNGQNQLTALPGIGDVPILGALFRSTTYQRNESELVIIVTPFLVRPVTRTADLHVPNEGVHFSSEIERILLGRITAAPSAASSQPLASQSVPHLQGAAGFILE
jgi:pilus assembly protein CpaC